MMSGTGVPSNNPVPGAQQNSYYSNDPSRNHFQANNLGKHGNVMQGNFAQMDDIIPPQSPLGVDGQGLKNAASARQFGAGQHSHSGATTMGTYPNIQYNPQGNTRQAGPPQPHQPYQGTQLPNQPQNYYHQGASNSIPNGPLVQGRSSQLNGTITSNTASSQGLLSTISQPVSSATSSASPQTVNRNSPMSMQRNQPSASSGPRPQMQQVHSGSAFTPLAGSRPVQQNLPTPSVAGSAALPTATMLTTPVSPSSQTPAALPVSPPSQTPAALPVSPPSQTPAALPVSPPSQTPATLPVSPPSQSPGSHRSTPSPKPLSALQSGKPKRPGLPVGPSGTYPGQQGVPTRSTPPSSGPPTPSGMPSASIQGQASPTSYPGASSDSSLGRPSAIMSKRRQYPTQQTPSLSGPAGQGYPGQIPGQMPGQMPGQVPGQMPAGQMPGQMPGQVPGQMPAGQMPGQMPGQVPGQMPGQMTGPTQGPHTPQPMGYPRGQAPQMPYGGLEGPMNRLTVQQPTAVHPVNLLEERNIVPTTPVEHSTPPLSSDLQKKNSDPSVLCCTLNSVPETKSLLTKSRLPFAIHLHPFKDLASLPVIHSSVITRCRSCRTYINPFVTFTESRKWRCPMCFRTNEVPDEFCYDPTTKSYGDPSRRPEIKASTVEFIAPSEYMLRPPQPAVFLFMFDVSFNAVETGYLHSACKTLKENLDKMPGDSRTLVGFITYDSKIHFYSLRPKSAQPQMLIVSDLDDVFLPAPDDLLVNLKENMELIHQLLDALPTMFSGTHNVHSATGAAMQAALKLVGPTGGRVTVFQTTLPNIGPGELKRREEPNQKSNPKDVANLAPATDFYKKFALDCAAEQVAIDLFLLSTQYADISSLMCASKYSGGCISYYQNFHAVRNPTALEKFENEFTRYLTRKIGFEAVMRVRCTRGLTIHTFHGNFFVRSTDLVSLPNINPDTGFTMQIDIEDNLSDSNIVCFQSALLYTSSKGERRIRVHTLAMPTTTKLADVYAYADQQAISTLLAKMAVDRTLSSSLGDAREALMNASVDFMTVYKQHVANQPQSTQLLAPYSLRLLPLYTLALLKNVAFRLGSTARLDERCYAMQQLKTMPVNLSMLTVYPSMYPLHDISEENGLHTKNGVVPQPPCYNLSAEKLSRQGVFLMDAGNVFYIWVGKETPNEIIQQMFNVPSFNNLAENMGALPELENALNQRVRCFIDYLQSQRNCHAVLHVFREDSRNRTLFLNNLVDDRAESVMSYYEFLVHLQRQVNK